jgi:hypothetical protein
MVLQQGRKTHLLRNAQIELIHTLIIQFVFRTQLLNADGYRAYDTENRAWMESFIPCVMPLQTP